VYGVCYSYQSTKNRGCPKDSFFLFFLVVFKVDKESIQTNATLAFVEEKAVLQSSDQQGEVETVLGSTLGVAMLGKVKTAHLRFVLTDEGFFHHTPKDVLRGEQEGSVSVAQLIPRREA
jgi:hypothetical protein